ncbi:MAG: methyltransferase domain-containing protein [Bacteroidota bacterium]
MKTNKHIERKRILVHLGCGPEVQPSDWIDCDGSWNVLSGKFPSPVRKMILKCGQLTGIKLQEWPRHVRFFNLRKRFPFNDSSVDAIYASHVWEHLSRFDAKKATQEAFRVLKEGAFLRLVVPDLYYFCQSYVLSNNENAADLLLEELHLRDRGEKKSLLIHLYTIITDFHSHKWMYDARSLSKLLISAGFIDVSEKKCYESAIPEIQQVENPGRVSNEAGIAIEGMKPQNTSG